MFHLKDPRSQVLSFFILTNQGIFFLNKLHKKLKQKTKNFMIIKASFLSY